MKRCKRCGCRCSGVLCLECRYRDGAKISESDQDHSRTLVAVFASRSRTMFRAGFTSDQLQQVSPSER